MPFDNTSTVTIPDKTLVNRRHLIEALRQPLPFKWDYGNCWHCAMGLAARLGLMSEPDTVAAAEALGIDAKKAKNIFLWLGFYRHLRYVTPEMIAEELEKL